MTRDTADEARVIEYLLDQVDPEERDRIEERYMSDPAFLDQVKAVECELIDRYVRGELADPAAFEAHFLASPARREKVAFARALMQSSPVTGSRQRSSAGSRTWPWAAAAALVLATVAWLLLSNRPPVDHRTAGGTGPTPAPPVSGTETPTPPGGAASTPPGSGPRVVRLMLATTSTRDRGKAPTLIVGDADEVRLQLSLEADGYPGYRVVIRSVDGAEAWRQDRLRPQSGSDGPFVSVIVPANRFASDDYTITLSGVSASGEAEEVGGYYFRARAGR